MELLNQNVLHRQTYIYPITNIGKINELYALKNEGGMSQAK